MTTRQQRFKQIRNENPGPGSYEVIHVEKGLELNKTLSKKLTNIGEIKTVQTRKKDHQKLHVMAA